MFKITTPLKKTILAVLVLAIGLAIFPVTGVSAANLDDQTPSQPKNLRLERVWMRQQAIYRHQSEQLENSSTYNTRVQDLINRANENSWDTSDLQNALENLGAVIPAIQAAHEPGAAIIASHAGFDATGKVIDREDAITSVKALGQVLKDTHTAMVGTGKALRQALRDFREAHPRPISTPQP